METVTNVGIIDDHSLFRSGVEDIINDSKKFKVTVSASNGNELYSQLRKQEIAILLLDINLKDENGLDILEKLIKEKPDLKIIMLTMHNEPAYINTMVKQGAHGYLMKDTTPQVLIDTLVKVQENGRYYDSYTTNILVEAMQSKHQLNKLGMDLSDLELQILKLISDGKTAEEIGGAVFKSTRTIEGYRHKLLEKTNTKNIAELVSWGYKNNFL